MAGRITTEIKAIDNSILAVVTVDNSARLNCLNSALIAELTAAFDDLEKKKDLGCVILTGAGDKAFIGGADINEMAALNPVTARRFISGLHEFCHRIRYFPMPVIARINGFCLGAGMEVAACCDISVAVEAAQFAMPEVQVGIPSVIDAALLPQIIGTGLAREMVLTGRAIGADQAKTCGLVQHVVAAEDLDTQIDEVAGSLMSAGPKALQLQKQLCNIWENEPLASGIEKGIDAFARAYETEEPHDMMSRFINRKRQPI